MVTLTACGYTKFNNFNLSTGESGGLVQQAMTTATVMTLSDSSPTGTLHYHNTKPEIDLEAEILKY